MIRFFGDNRPLALFFLPLIVLLYHLSYHFFYTPFGPLDLDFGWWGNTAIKNGKASLFYESLAAFWVLVNAILLNFVFNSAELNEKNTYLPSLNFIVFFALSPNFYELSGVHLAFSFLILALHQFLQLDQNKSGSSKIFNSGLFLGLASTFYPPLILLFPIGISMYLVFRPFLLSEFKFYLFGWTIPFIYLLSWSFIKDATLHFFTFGFNQNFAEATWQSTIEKAGFAAILIVGMIGVISKSRMANNRFKKEIQLVNILGASLLVSYVFSGFQLSYKIATELFILPLSIYMTFSLLTKRLQIASSLVYYILFIVGLFMFLILNLLR